MPALNTLARELGPKGLTVVGVYGMSEVQALVARQDEAAPLAERRLAGGRCVAPEARVRARDVESGVIQPHGVAGELELKVPSCMVGYYGDEAATRAAFTADGYLRTGDLGYSTAESAFVFLTRLGDTLGRRGRASCVLGPDDGKQVLLRRHG